MKFVFTAFIELSSPGVLEGNTIIDASLFYFSKKNLKVCEGFCFYFQWFIYWLKLRWPDPQTQTANRKL